MGKFTDIAKNNMVNHEASSCTYMSLHSADPGSTGANELSGGSYSRQSCSWNSASGGQAQLSADVTFDVPGGSTVAYVGYWDAASGGNFRGSDQVAQETFSADGQYVVDSSNTYLAINDPA